MTDPSGYQYGATDPNEMQQKMDDYLKREALLNMNCSYPEHDEAIELLRQLKNDYLWVHGSTGIELKMKIIKFFEKYKL